MLITPVFISTLLLVEVVSSHWHEELLQMETDNFFFDIMVPIVLDVSADNSQRFKVIATGILLNQDIMVTSYNPFRELVKDANMLKRIKALPVSGRKKYGHRLYEVVFSDPRDFNCGRQVAYTPDDPEDRKRIWHGDSNGHRNSPVHDLFVLAFEFRIWRVIDIHSDSAWYNHKWYDDQILGYTYLPGPFSGIMADEHHIIDGWVQFSTLYLTPDEELSPSEINTFNEELRRFRHVKIWHYEFKIHQVDCDDYFPRSWGHFICLNNTDGLQTLSSGAVLVHYGKVYGLGSFVLHRKTGGVLVFTDLRPYHHQIWNTCTGYDLNPIPWTVDKLTSASNNDEQQLELLFKDENEHIKRTGFTWWEMFDRYFYFNYE